MNRFSRLSVHVSARAFRRRAAAVLFLAAGLGLSACSGDDEAKKYVERPVSQIYETALKAMDRADFAFAAQEFDEVERQHPYSVWATRAKIMAAYAHYLYNQYDSAIIALDRFIQ
ncbi:MAG: outer membrane protein assembly factor BamD, partial [Rhodospirillales bacterium]